MSNIEEQKWHEDQKYQEFNDRKLNMWLDTGRMLSALEVQGAPMPEHKHKEETIKALADIELFRLKPRNW